MNADARSETPAEPQALEQEDVPVLRLSGEQIDSIEPPPDGDWFVDFDEYEEFVPKRLFDALRASRESAGAFLGELREALERTIVAIDDPARYTEVNPHYRAGWVDALSALRDDPALAATPPAPPDPSVAGEETT